MKTIISANPADPVVQLEVWIDLACGILDAMASHSVRWKEAEHAQFQHALAATLDLLRSQPSAASLRVFKGTLSKRIERYQQQTQQAIHGSVSELNDIVRILMSSTGKAHADCAGSVGELHRMEEIIRSARTSEEFEAIKVHLVDSLGRLKKQTLEWELATSQLLTGVRERVFILEQSLGAGAQPFSTAAVNSSASPPVPSREGVERAGMVETNGRSPASDGTSATLLYDATTGLPGPEAAEAAILVVKSSDRPHSYVVAFHVKRMKVVNARFGEKCANDLLLFCAQQISRLTSQSQDSLFRWRGSGGFVAILNREGFLVDVRQEVGTAFASNTMFESGDGSVLLPINVSTNVLHMAAHNSAELFEGLTKFFSLASIQG